MNIFFLDYDVVKCAKYHCDKHVVKMILETAQLLCGAHHVTNSKLDIPYKISQKKSSDISDVIFDTESMFEGFSL